MVLIFSSPIMLGYTLAEAINLAISLREEHLLHGILDYALLNKESSFISIEIAEPN